MADIQLSEKQYKLLNTVKENKHDQVFMIGAIGTSKTYGMAHALISIAWQAADSFIPVGRKTLSEARVGTILSFIEVMRDMRLVENLDYRLYGAYGGNDMKIVFSNKSIIQFIPMDHTKDPEWQRIKSINATAAGVDEVDGVAESGFNMLDGRVGRKNNNGAPAVLIATCNPNESWVKDRVYLPYHKGTLPPKTKVIEFKIQDSFLYQSGFYDRYDNNPKQWRERYLNNNWDYLDDEQSLFKSRVLDNISVAKYNEDADRFAGQDVAREGKDRSVTAQIVGNVLTDIVVYNKADLDYFATEEEKDAPPYSHILGRKFIKYCMDNSIGYSNTAGDAVGLGAGFIDYCRSEGFYTTEYKAGARSESDYDMIRSQVAAMLAKDMEEGQFFIYEGCPHVSELKKELLYHQYTVADKLMKIESKQQLKKRLGRSPDIADSVFIAYWKMKFGRVGSFDIMPSRTGDSGEAVMPGAEEAEKPITAGLMGKQF